MYKLFVLVLMSLSLIAGDYEKGFAAYKQHNYKVAKTYFEKSAKAGNSSAQYYLGELYDKGQGTKRDRKIALEWYKKAEKNGDKVAKKRMQKLRQNTQAKYIKLGKSVNILGIKITLDIDALVDAPTGGGIIYGVYFQKGSHKKKELTDSTDRGTFEFLNYRIKFYDLGENAKVTVTRW